MTHRMNRQLAISVVLLSLLSACASDYDDEDDAEQAPPVTPSAAQVERKRPAPQTLMFGTDADHPPLSNQGDAPLGDRIPSISVQAGDRIEIVPSALIREDISPLPPTVTREDHNVCVQTAQVCAVKVPRFERRCERRCFGGCYTECHDEQVGEQCMVAFPACVQTQNQWRESATYEGLGAPTLATDPSPMKSDVLLKAGLKLRLSFMGSDGVTQQIDCSLERFAPETQFDRFVFHLHPVEGCAKPLPESAMSNSSVILLNEMGSPIQYSKGRLVTTWDGRVLEQPTTVTYHPRIDFYGTLTVNGN